MKKQVELALTLEPSELSIYQKKILELDRKLALRNLLVQAYVPPEEILENQDWARGFGQRRSREPAPLCIPTESAKKGWETFARALAHKPVPEQSSETASGSRDANHERDPAGSIPEGDTSAFNREVGRVPGDPSCRLRRPTST